MKTVVEKAVTILDIIVGSHWETDAGNIFGSESDCTYLNSVDGLCFTEFCHSFSKVARANM